MSSNSNLSLPEIFYVYIFIDPRNGLPFYVGKGKNDRWRHHFKRCHRKSHSLKSNRINRIVTMGLEVIVQFYVLDVQERTAFLVERALIRKYGRIDIGTGILCNHTDGGEGTSGFKYESKESHPRFGKPGANRGKKFSDDTRHKMSIAMMGQDQKGSKNHNAKLISIFDEEGVLRFKCHGDFKDVCLTNGLPYDALVKSYKKAGSLLYQKKRPTNEFESFIGWSAVAT